MSKTTSKTIITVSRLWNNPQITTTVSDKSIALEMSIHDFEEALLAELTPITFTFTEKQLKLKLHKSIKRIISGIKEESAKVV